MNVFRIIHESGYTDIMLVYCSMFFLQCMRLSHQLRTTGPLVVHCSAGIGRTGTFITVDVALAHVEKALKVSIMTSGGTL